MNLKLLISTARVLLTLTGCGSQSLATEAPASKTFTMSGHVFVAYQAIDAEVITGSLKEQNLGLATRKEGSACAGSVGGADDISSGVQVTVTDEKGTVIGASALEGGKFTHPTKDKLGCVFGFTVANVPLGRTFYGVAVSHRGIVQFTPDSAKTPELTLGS
jgi:hypothetical protein